MTNADFDAELAELLEQLSDAQEQLLALLTTKRELIHRQDHRALAELAPREQAVSSQLQACHERRQKLLTAAEADGLPSASLVELNAALPTGNHAEPLLAARKRSQLIRHECLSQWVVVQRTVLHLAQMLEIIATGGRSQPTYGSSGPPHASGALMDQAV